MKKLLLGLFFVSLSVFANTTQEYPELKKFLFKEPKSDFLFGLGVSPIGIANNRFVLSVNFFEFHWRHEPFDVEIFKASFGFGYSQQSYAGSRTFTIRTSPKFTLFHFLSIGPLIGYEYVSFPDVKSTLQYNQFATPTEPFSSLGLIYGAAVSETFPFQNDYLLKITQTVFQETYSTTQAGNGWTYVFEEPSLQNDPARTQIKPSLVLMVDFSLLY